jgi:hypothetical protein
MKPTAECYALADRLIAAVEAKDRDAVAAVLSQVHDRAVGCIGVRSEHFRRIARIARELQDQLSRRRKKRLEVPEVDPRQPPMFEGEL